jgi:VWFA-related protein
LRFLYALLILLPVDSLWAGHQSQATSPPQAPVFRGAVDYVLADVVVTDNRDQPVRGLSRDDFEIVMNDRRQPILEFKEISIPAGNREIVTTALAATTVDVARNEPATTGRQMVLVIDDLHILPQDIIRTRDAVRDFLRFLSNGDQVAIVFTGHSDLGVDFTSDLSRLGVVVDRIREATGLAKGPRRMEPTVNQTAYPKDNDAFDPEESRIALLERRTQAEQMMFAIRNVGRALSESTHPHRALILISSGTDFDLSSLGDGQELLYQLRKTFDDAEKANVRVYTLDPRGLVLPDTATLGAPPRDPYEAESIRRRIQHQQQYLRTVAENTGGLAMVAHPNLTEAMRQIVVDNGSFYLLGFNATGPLDGKFHEFDVRVTKPGLRVRARKGYTATGAKATATATTLTASLDEALGLACRCREC